jgi:nucleoside-diphosphate-sugar epimerase
MGTHVILGAGPVGSFTARHLAAAGHDVVVGSRRGGGPSGDRISTVAVDALDTDSLTRLCEGAETVYNACSPPYTQWAELWPPLATSILTAAGRSGAVLVTMSNLYGYRIDGPLSESTPLDPGHDKGMIRTRMWDEALAAQRSGTIPAVVEARAADFFGPEVVGSSVGYAMPAVLAGKTARIIGRADMVHSFTYIDDVGRALAVLGTDPRGHNRIWHVPTNPALTQTEMLGRLAAAAGAPAPKIAATSKAVLSVLGVFSKDLGEMKKVYDQFDRPFVLDSSAFTHTFGIGATPLDEAVRATATWWVESEAVAEAA